MAVMVSQPYSTPRSLGFTKSLSSLVCSGSIGFLLLHPRHVQADPSHNSFEKSPIRTQIQPGHYLEDSERCGGHRGKVNLQPG